MPKKDIVVINTDLLWYRSEAGREAAWTTNDSVAQVQLVRSFETQEERSGKLAMRNHNVFWFVPTKNNADFLLANFRIESVKGEGKQTVFALSLADSPTDSYWKNMKARSLELSGTLEFDPATGLPVKGEVKMLRDGYLREYRVTIESSSTTVPADAAVIPREVEEKAAKPTSRRR